MPSIFRPALVILTCLALAAPALAQDRREQLTALAEEAALQLEKTESDDARRTLRDQLESYRHELGYRDARDRTIAWTVSYTRTLIDQLDAELKAMPVAPDQQTKARRAWREIARAALLRAETELDETERLRNAHAAMLLVHNADLVDPLINQWPKIDAARKALTTDSPDDLRAKLSQAAGGYNQLTQLATRLTSGQAKLGSTETWQLRQALERIRIGIAVADGKIVAEETPDPDTVPPEQNEQQLQHLAALRDRVAKLANLTPKPAELIQTYLPQAELGLQHPRARDQAIRLQQSLETAADTADTIARSTVASPEYRAAQTQRLMAALENIADPQKRDAAYREIRDQHHQDRFRRYFDQFEMTPPLKAALWTTLELADRTANTSSNEDQKRHNADLRAALENLSWRAAQHYTQDKLADRMLAGLHARMLKALEADLIAALPAIRARNDQSAGAAWRAIGRLDDLNRLRSIDSEAQQVEEYQALPAIIRTAIGQAANMLVDNDPGNDGQGRNSLGRLLTGLRHMTEFLETARPAAWFTPEFAGPAGPRVATAWKNQHARLIPMIRTYVEQNPTERDLLVNSLPLYRLSAHLAIFRHAAADDSLQLLTVGRQFTFNPKLIVPLAELAANDLLPPLMPNVARAADKSFVDQAAPLRLRENVCRAAALALQQRRRQSDNADRLALLLDELRIAAAGDPGSNRDRWRASWNANQAADAYRLGFTRTADFHAAEIQRQYALPAIRLLTKEEQK